MASSLSMLTLCLLTLFVLFAQAKHSHGPAPTAQPGNSPAPTAHPVGIPTHGVTEGSLHPQECSGRCSGRCSSTAYKKPCLFFCQKCCAKCLCVSAGTYGNKQFCPCYNNWKTKRGGPICP